MKKRLCSLFLIFSLLLPALVPHSIASSDVYVAINNAMLPITDAKPISSGGLWYIDYRCFTSGDLGISSSYNPDSQTLTLYTWDNTLVFDIAKETAKNHTTDKTYRRSTLRSNGTIYVPAKFVCNQLNVRYSFISSVNVIRIKSNSTVNDNVFAYIAKDELPRLIAQYEASKAESPSQNNPTTSPSSGEEEAKTVYLTFEVGTNTDCSSILNTLRRFNAKATFFLFGSAIPAHRDSIRQMAINGHALGISAPGATSVFLESDTSVVSGLAETNELLFQTSYQKSRLVRIPGGSSVLSNAQANAVVSAGYRYWDWDIDASAMSNQRLRNLVAASGDSVVIRFDASATSTKSLSNLLSYLKSNNYRTAVISFLKTPQNQRQDLR